MLSPVARQQCPTRMESWQRPCQEFFNCGGLSEAPPVASIVILLFPVRKWKTEAIYRSVWAPSKRQVDRLSTYCGGGGRSQYYSHGQGKYSMAPYRRIHSADKLVS